MKINLSLMLKKKNRIQKHFPLSVLVFIDSLVVSASQDAGGHALSFQNNLTFGIDLHVVAWVYGRSFVRYVITKFSRMDSLPNFLTQDAPLARLARESSAKNVSLYEK